MPDHRLQRLEERYGLRLSRAEVDSLDALCTPTNRVQRGAHGDVHVILWCGVYLIAVAKALRRGGYGICTFLPPDVFTAGHGRKNAIKATGKARKRSGWRRDAMLRHRREGRPE